MTMTVVHTDGDQAQIMTDGLAYNGSMTYIKATPEAKATVLEGINTAVASRGSYVLGQRWKRAAAYLTAEGYVDGFDTFVEHVPTLLRRIIDEDTSAVGRYNARTGEYEAPAVEAYAVGWSPSAERFRAFVWHSQDPGGPTGEEITGALHVVPAPVGCPPSTVEQRVRERNGEKPLREGKPAPAPWTDEQWRLLAKVVHKSRAQARIGSGLKIPIGGDVTLTTLTRSGVDQRVIHRYTAEDFEAMIAGTLHPMIQLGPCDQCDSGKRLVDCCLHKVFDEPCLCGSGETFGDCCKVDADAGELAAA